MKKVLLWIIAILVTLASAFYQRKTGPTYPKKIEIQIADKSYEFKLPRSGDSNNDVTLKLPLMDTIKIVKLHYRRYPLNETFNVINMVQSDIGLVAYLPKQPPAGKLEYFLSFYNQELNIFTETEHVTIRFKGIVPSWALIPHVIFMFIAMMLSNLAGLFAIGKVKKHIFYGRLTLILLLLGGMILGPIVQYYAFGQAWTGIPFGWDLTDNKTLIAVMFWIIAVWGNYKSPKYRYTIIASIVLLLIYIIPHSLFGSELNYESGEVVTGIISLFF